MQGETPGAILRATASARREAGEAILRELAAHRDSGFTGFLRERAQAWPQRPALRIANARTRSRSSSRRSRTSRRSFAPAASAKPIRSECCSRTPTGT